MSSVKVLIVDDEKLLVKSTSMALKYAGFETVGVLDGPEGLRVAREWGPEVILLDVMMPGMDGWSVLERLKQDEGTREIPVIVFTAKEYSDGRALARSRGAADYLAKPFELEELEAVIRRYAKAGEDEHE